MVNSLDFPEHKLFYLLCGVWVVLRTGKIEDTGLFEKVSTTVVFHYLLVTDSSVQSQAGAMQ